MTAKKVISNVTDIKKQYETFNDGFMLDVPTMGGKFITIKVKFASAFELNKNPEIAAAVNSTMPQTNKPKTDEDFDISKYTNNMTKYIDLVLDRCVIEPAYADIKEYLIIEQKQFIIDKCIINDISELDKAMVEDIKKN